jgi:hypothetical protein
VRALIIPFLVACSSPPRPPVTQPPPQEQPPPTDPVAAGEEKFTGTITKIDFGCAADARCDLVVDNTKNVHFGHDTRREGGKIPFGNTDEVFTLMDKPNQGVGTRVEVFAAKAEGGYTLQGKTDYYIKVLP